MKITIIENLIAIFIFFWIFIWAIFFPIPINLFILADITIFLVVYYTAKTKKNEIIK